MKREIIEQFQGKENVIHVITDNGVDTYLTQGHSFVDEANAKGASSLNTVENETKHVLFLFNDKGQEVSRYYIGKKLQGKTPEELAELKHSIVVFESYNLRTKQWVPCVGIQAPPQSAHLHKSKVKEQKPPYPLKNGFIGSKPKYEFTEKMFREELANQKEKDLLEYGTTDNKEKDQIKKEKKEKTKINIVLVIIIFIVPILFMGMIQKCTGSKYNPLEDNTPWEPRHSHISKPNFYKQPLCIMSNMCFTQHNVNAGITKENAKSL